MSDEGPLLTITDAAREKAERFRSRDPNADKLALWLEVTGEAKGEYQYNMILQYLDRAGPDDAVQYHDDLPVVVPAASVDALRGATLDRKGDLETGGIYVVNPNRPASASPTIDTPPPGDLSGELPQRVTMLLEQHINPAIAAHGGRAELVAVEDGTAYLRLGGGCQGCGMASVTLSQGIETALRHALPEIKKVVDVTDHAAGDNPYFEPAGK